MATKTVGIRELKNGAPQLVQRVERGERFVITRHGRVAAQLGPVTAEPSASAGRERLREWQQERNAFRRLAPQLARRLSGRYVAMHQGRVVDDDGDPAVLFERVARSLRGTFFIGRVGAPEPFVDMPGFDVE